MLEDDFYDLTKGFLTGDPTDLTESVQDIGPEGESRMLHNTLTHVMRLIESRTSEQVFALASKLRRAIELRLEEIS